VRDHHLFPLVVGVVVMVVWGGTPLFSKLAAAEIDPLMVGVLRTVIAGSLALPLVLLWRLGLPADGRSRALLAYSGFAAFVAFPLIYTIGQAQTSATHGALILATLPVFTSLFGTLVERRRVSMRWIAGCSIALAGEALVIVSRANGGADTVSTFGDAVVLISAVLCSTGYVAGARLSQRGYPSQSTTLWGVALSSAAVLPLFGWLLVRDGIPHAGPVAWGSVLVLAVLTSIVGYIAWYWALARGGISRVAGVQFTQPLFGMLLAAVVLSERPTPVTLVAAVAILAGAWLVQRASRG
jgi:drug/metabolite transporter (DMT)-like permease